MVRNLIPSEEKRRKSSPCVSCVLFASPCHKGPHGRSTKSNIVVVQDTQTGSDTNSLTDMDGDGISARRLEICKELGIPTDLYLALPPDAFCEASVEDAGPQWEKRFYDQVAAHPNFRTLSENDTLPEWLRAKPTTIFGSGITIGCSITRSPWEAET